MKKTNLFFKDAVQDAHIQIRQAIENDRFMVDMPAYCRRVVRNEELKNKYGKASSLWVEWTDLIGDNDSEYLDETGTQDTNNKSYNTSGYAEKCVVDRINTAVEGRTEVQKRCLKIHSQTNEEKETFDKDWRGVRDDLKLLIRKNKPIPTALIEKNDGLYRRALSFLDNLLAILPPPEPTKTILEERVEVLCLYIKVLLERWIGLERLWEASDEKTQKQAEIELSFYQNREKLQQLQCVLEKIHSFAIPNAKKSSNPSLSNDSIDFNEVLSLENNEILFNKEAREIKALWYYYHGLHIYENIHYTTMNAADTQYKKALQATRKARGIKVKQ